MSWTAPEPLGFEVEVASNPGYDTIRRRLAHTPLSPLPVACPPLRLRLTLLSDSSGPLNTLLLDDLSLFPCLLAGHLVPMNRRRFSQTILGAFGGLANLPWSFRPAEISDRFLAGPASGILEPGAMTEHPATPDLRVDGPRLLETMEVLSGFGRTPEGGVHRVAFGDADLEARVYVQELLEAAEFSTHVDPAGNLVGRVPGTDATLPPIMTGSHVDSVPQGGRFDGNVGVMAAVEVARSLHQAGHRLRHPLEVVVFANEEGGKTGSRAMSGEVTPEEWDLPTASGYSIGDGTRRIGGDPDRLAEVEREPGSIQAFVELHIEQGAFLHGEDIDIGVVQGIVGIRRWNVTVDGFANHAGTTPMEDRHDALVAAARFVDEVHRTARETPGRQVATVGRIEAAPGAPNVIPGRATLSLEIRDLEMETIQHLLDRLRERARIIGGETGTTFAFEPFYLSGAAPTAPAIRDDVEAAARELGLSTLRMPSGAGHDAQSIALLAPIGMIFIPSVGGISHSPQEYSEPQDIVAGADVLLRTLLRLDERMGR